MKRVATFLGFILIGVVLVLLAVANRAPVSLDLDPLSIMTPPVIVSAPFYLFLFGATALGVILGGATVWLSQGRHRRSARLSRRAVRRLTQENEHLKASQPGSFESLKVPFLSKL